jgi:hypothetical protein
MDPLYSAIVNAIEKPLDGYMFERCAVELLRDDYYPTLRPVEGGNDAGLDGVGELPDETRFFLVSTVAEDAKRNLYRNIRSYLKAGGDRRAVVLATTRPVSGQRRLALASALDRDFGFRLVEVHDRADFVQLLYRNPSWRKTLLAVSGQAKALTQLPTNRRPTPRISMVGRVDDLRTLRESHGDLVIVGKPGIGKTYVLQALMEEGWGLFDDGWALPDLEDAIREMRPLRVVLDDAHMKDDRLAQLRRLRTELDADFSIVASTWPGQLPDVSSMLPDSEALELRELERDQILEVIKEVGLQGPRDLLAHLVDQSWGRAGLAVTLAYACLRGHLTSVAKGDALFEDITGWYTRTMGSEARHVLGVLALAGRRGASLAEVCSSLGLALPRVSDLVRGMASGGTIDEVLGYERSRLRVQPESLRYALVRNIYFAGAGSLDARDVVGHLEAPSSAVLPLIGAANRGAPVNPKLLVQLLDPHDEEAVMAYALLGPEEASTALEVAPQQSAAIARAAYRSGIDQPRMLHLLMSLAVDDDRAEHSWPDHPLRVIGDSVLEAKDTVEARRIAVAAVAQWLEQGGRPDIASRVLANVMWPGMRWSELDPGIGRTLTLYEGALSPALVADMAMLWDRVFDMLERHTDIPAGPILNKLHYWVFPGIIGFGKGADDETRMSIQSEASRVVVKLAAIWQHHPGALRRLHHYSNWGGLGIDIDVPRAFDVLFPEDERGRDYKEYLAWERETNERARVLASELQGLPTTQLAQLIADTEKEAILAEVTYPRLTPQFVRALASGVEHPDSLMAELQKAGAPTDLLLPLLERVVELGLPSNETLQMILDSRTSWIAIQAALKGGVSREVRELAISQMTPSFKNLIEALILRGEIDMEVVELLLEAPDPLVRRDAAVALGHARSELQAKDLSEELRARWRQVILESPPDDYWFSEILKGEPEIFADWLRAWFGRLRGDTKYEFLPNRFEESVSDLPLDIRLQLIREAPADVGSFYLQDVMSSLVADDVEAAIALLERSDLEELHWTALRYGPSEAWLRKARVAIERGWDPKQVVASTVFAESGWSGEESMHWQGKIDEFEKLGQQSPGDAVTSSLAATGIELFTKQKMEAAERERRERVFGLGRR